MACAAAVVATDCPSVADDIVRDGVDGILVPRENVYALADAMERLMTDRNERKRIASRAPEVLDRFSIEMVTAMWEELLRQVCEKQHS